MNPAHILLRLSALMLLAMAAWAEEPLASFDLNSVNVTITLERSADGHATLVGVYTPKTTDPPLHIYSTELTGTIGVPTRLDIKDGEPAHAAGALTSDQKAHLSPDALLVYPPGPVTVRLPITLPPGSGEATAVTVLISYMACTEQSCMNPVVKHAVVVQLPTVAGSGPVPSTTSNAPDVAAIKAAVREELAAQRPALVAEIAHATAQQVEEAATQHASITWQRPTTVAEVTQMIATAHQNGKAVLLDFTGPSCVNCQRMEKSVFRVPAVSAAWNQAVPISVSTDPPNEELADWQQKTFQTQGRPLYIRIGVDGSQSRWSDVFAPSNQETLTKFLSFLTGGTGSDHGTGSGLVQFILLALGGGLFTLLMPCTYPMIPFTVNFFSKQAAGGRSLVPLATFYALGIIGCFVGLGVVITGVLGANLATIGGHPLTNLLIGILFLVLGLSLLGAFLLRLPTGWEDRLGGGRSGYIGALIMGLTFAITAFSCTAPFAGSVLAAAVSSGDTSGWLRAIGGMAIYSGAIAVPFFFLAISPAALHRLPKAGAWMNEFKVVGGLVEIAAALKFLALCDNAWGWGVIGRTSTLAIWTAISLFCAYYVLGRVRLPGDQQLPEVGLGRVLIAILFLALGLWFASGLMGVPVGLVESFFPGDAVPGR